MIEAIALKITKMNLWKIKKNTMKKKLMKKSRETNNSVKNMWN